MYVLFLYPKSTAKQLIDRCTLAFHLLPHGNLVTICIFVFHLLLLLLIFHGEHAH